MAMPRCALFPVLGAAVLVRSVQLNRLNRKVHAALHSSSNCSVFEGSCRQAQTAAEKLEQDKREAAIGLGHKEDLNYDVFVGW